MCLFVLAFLWISYWCTLYIFTILLLIFLDWFFVFIMGIDPLCVLVVSDSLQPECSSPGSSVHGILQARILECVTILFSRGTSNPWIKPRSPILQADSLPSDHKGSPLALINLQPLFPPYLCDIICHEWSTNLYCMIVLEVCFSVEWVEYFTPVMFCIFFTKDFWVWHAWKII